MSCRETAGGSIATSWGRIRTGLTDVQAISTFHSLVREGRGRADPTPAEVQAWTTSMRASIDQQPGLSTARRTSLHRRLDRLAQQPNLDGATFYACQQMDDRAHSAHQQLTSRYEQLAGRLGVPVEEVTARARHYEQEAAGDRRGGQRRAAPDHWQQEVLAQPGAARLPRDRGTLYALHRLEEDAATAGAAHAAEPLPELRQAAEQPHVARRRAGVEPARARAGGDPDVARPRAATATLDHEPAPPRHHDEPAPRRVGTPEPPHQRPTAAVPEEPVGGPAVTRPRVVRHPVESSAIRRLGYDPDGGRLEVEFPSGQVVAYRDVPAELYERMVAPGGSAGSVYARQIRGNHAYLYPTQADAEADSVQRQCPVCGQFTGPVHACPGAGEPDGAGRRVAADVDQPAARARAANRTTERTYRSDTATIRMLNVTAIRDATRTANPDQPWATVPVDAQVYLDGGGQQVTGDLTVERQGDGQYRVGGTPTLHCSCVEDVAITGSWCRHAGVVVREAEQRLNARRIRDPEHTTARTAVTEDLTAGRAASVDVQSASRARWEVEDATSPVRYASDMGPFQRAYDDARTRRDAGEPAVPYLTEDATGGLGARQGGRGFGVELEFDLAPGVDRNQAIANIGRDLHAAGISDSPYQHSYHSRHGSYTTDPGGWRLESDSTVAGEIVSPIMYDDPTTWRNLAQVCEIVRRHGGAATARTGGHVHVASGDYDHTVANHNKLLQTFDEHQDVLYRLAQNPAAQAHRGTFWCAPNAVPARGYTSVADARTPHSTHGVGINLDAVSGRPQDHVEYRMWDGSLDPGVIQTQVKVSLALTDHAYRTADVPSYASEPLGTHQARNQGLGRGQRLTGEGWRADTSSFRAMVDKLFTRAVDKAQATALFAVTRWQRR
jgi:hypothetical protein